MFKGFAMCAAHLHKPRPLPDSNYYFETISSALSAALIAAAADQLFYDHCKLHRNGKDAVFVFRDPSQVGEELQRRYKAGALPLVHAKVLADARSFLVTESKRVREGGNARK